MIYRLAVSAAKAVAIFVHPLQQTLLQVFVRTRDSGGDAMRRLVRRSTVFAVVVATASGAITVLIGNRILSAVLGEQVDVTFLLLLLTLRYVMQALVVWGIPLLLALDLARVVGRRAILYIVVYPALLIPGAMIWGPVGAAAALLSASAVVEGYTGLTGLRHIQALP